MTSQFTGRELLRAVAEAAFLGLVGWLAIAVAFALAPARPRPTPEIDWSTMQMHCPAGWYIQAGKCYEGSIPHE